MTEIAEQPQAEIDRTPQPKEKGVERRNPQRLRAEQSMRVNEAWLRSLEERVSKGTMSLDEKINLTNLALIKRELQRDKAKRIDGTGLFRQELIKTEIDRLIAEGRPFAVLQGDLDDFGNVNKTWGQSAGDEIIMQAALRLREKLREQEGSGREPDMPFKKGGDETLVVLPGIDNPEDLQKVTAKIMESITGAPFQIPLRDEKINLSTSMGGVVWRGEDSDHLLQKVDQNMLEAKKAKGIAVVS